MTKENLTYLIAELMYPNQSIKQSLEIRRIERCGYKKSELIEELERMPQYASYKRNQKLNSLGI